MSYRKIFLTVNPESGTLINPADGSSASMPSLYYGETAVLCISFLDGGLNIYPLAGSDTFELAADNDFVHGSDPLMIYSGNDMVDIPGDWNNISRESGRISVRVNCMTDGFATKLGASESIYFNLELKRYIAGSSSPSIMLISKAKGKNVVHLSENEPVPSDVNYYNAAQTDALLRAGREFQFSSDSVNWHNEQVSTDAYWRERYPSGDWSVAIALPDGAQGEKGDKGDKGDQGDSGTNAPAVQIQYSIDGSTNWHGTASSADFYMRISTDGATNWTTALKYKTIVVSSNPNLIINGSFRVNQRNYVSGTATTSANQYTLDRWRIVTSGQNLIFTTNGLETIATSPAGGIEQVIEGANIEGGTYTLSWTGTATATVNGNAIANGGNIVLTANADVTVKFSSGTVSNVKFEAGDVATAFLTRPYGDELRLCQRYLYVVSSGNSSGTVDLAVAFNYSNAVAIAVFQSFVPLRSTPSLTVSSASHFQVNGIVCNTVALNTLAPTSIGIAAAVASGLTANYASRFQSNNAAAKLYFSAEF